MGTHKKEYTNFQKTYIFLIITLFSVSFQMTGQGKVYSGDPDVSFKTARDLAFNKNRNQAQDTLLHILTKYPEYHDVREFLASTYAWDGNHKKARTEFQKILAKDTHRKTTWIAAIKNEMWGNYPFLALKLCKKALKKFPNDTEIADLQKSAQESTMIPTATAGAVQTISSEILNDSTTRKSDPDLIKTVRNNTIGVTSEVNIYSDVFDAMFYNAVKYARQTKYGSIIGRVNIDRRLGEYGTQYEVDLYPKIAKGTYAYLNFGVSGSSLFPDYRYGAEIFKSLPRSFEVSLGLRGLQYDTTTMIYTGSVTWYNGNNYWSLRPYFTPGDNGLSSSATLTYRKYRSDADNYFGINFGAGISPELNQNYFFTNDDRIVNLQSQKLNIAYFFSTHNKQNAWGAQLGIIHQEIPFDQGNYFWISTLALSWEIRFR
ncbi:YaiO family outer membrane beta-barrel protein [Flavobacterium pectinovorum]|uniref:YaiO family outer membrane beta-barrel protein n=1 Tax=Flavobacterium pectinovorum TaxID=29533 RepID=UPI001FAB3E6D|nr:YaiO family outer membrane beta-barrel protein [Flavobacterium pectinovorum]MCI9844991.1 YaiO family outer membrane beta-barrel protein [Flavobacterium pectinovorum]